MRCARRRATTKAAWLRGCEAGARAASVRTHPRSSRRSRCRSRRRSAPARQRTGSRRGATPGWRRWVPWLEALPSRRVLEDTPGQTRSASVACHPLPEAQPLALVADARLEHEPRSLRPLACAGVQRLVLSESLAVDSQLHLGHRARVGAEEELQQAEVPQLRELV